MDTDQAPDRHRRTVSLAKAAKRLSMTPAALRRDLERRGFLVVFLAGRWRCYAEDVEALIGEARKP